MIDPTRITVFCFAASYTVAFALELPAVVGWLRRRSVARSTARLLATLFTAAGVIAHVGYLILRAQQQTPPLSSPAEWCLLAALGVAVVVLGAKLGRERWAVAPFLLPVVLGLIAFSERASDAPFSTARASLFWGQVHGVSLLWATVTVSLGFAAGLMYFIQSRRLKRKLPPRPGLRLPSLEWLERTNGRALGISFWLVAAGLGSGIVLGQIRNQGVTGYSYLTDPAVWSLFAMFSWLVLAALLRRLYPATKRGAKVASLTVIAFMFLATTVGSITLFGESHGTVSQASSAEELAAEPPPQDAQE